MKDINKRLKQKHKRLAIRKRIEAIIYKILKPLSELEKYIIKGRENKRELIRELGRNMTMDRAVELSVNIIIEKLISREEDIHLVVAKYTDSDYGVYTSLKWIMRQIPINNKNKDYEMLRYYLYKNDRYGEETLKFNREFTQAIYDEISCNKYIKVEWVVDKERYGYFKSTDYEKTLIIELDNQRENR